MYCVKCGAPLQEGDLFCPTCGEAIEMVNKKQRINPAKLVFSIIAAVAGAIGLLFTFAVSGDYYAGDSFFPGMLLGLSGIVPACIVIKGGMKPLCLVGMICGGVVITLHIILAAFA